MKTEPTDEVKVTTVEEELAAISAVFNALNVLDECARARIVNYIIARFQIYIPS